MTLASLTRELQDFDWSNLHDIEAIGVWPGIVKGAIAVVIFMLCLGVGFWFDIRILQGILDRGAAEESVLRAEFATKAGMAASLDKYRAQTDRMEAAFAELLRQLPRQTEMPDLVDDVTETGLGSNLIFSRIELDEELEQEFYFEQSIRLEVTGSYHEFGAFVSGVASLPRIVTLHDFAITAVNERSALAMTVTAKTYRYRAEGDQNALVTPPVL